MSALRRGGYRLRSTRPPEPEPSWVKTRGAVAHRCILPYLPPLRGPRRRPIRVRKGYVSRTRGIRWIPVEDRDRAAVEALISDLNWQIDQMRPRGIKNAAGHQYYPGYYIRGLEAAIEKGGPAVVEYVRGFLYRPPSDGFIKFEAADSLDLACEALVRDQSKPYAHLFSDRDRAIANERLAPHEANLAARAEDEGQANAERRARIDALRAERREKGSSLFPEIDAARRHR